MALKGSPGGPSGDDLHQQGDRQAIARRALLDFDGRGATPRTQVFAFTPVLRIVDERAGGFQPISGNATLDLNFGFERKIDFGALYAGLSVLNVFDTAYIGFINNGYYHRRRVRASTSPARRARSSQEWASNSD